MNAEPAVVVVVMGVCGSGKTAVGRALAARLGAGFVDADDLHPPANVAKMAAGTPLDDADRAGWLDAVAARLGDAARAGRGLVVACSALKRTYRERLRRDAPRMRLVFLRGERALIASRLAARRGHYMPASLLQSQLDALEPPGPDEDAVACDVAAPVDAVAAEAARRFSAAVAR